MNKKTIITRKGAEVQSYTATYAGKSYNYSIQEPTFEQLSSALTESMGFSGKLNMTGGGKVIWELCCTEFDGEIEKNPAILLSITLILYDSYVLPVDVAIKKN